jgi:molybdopterin synthase catalytic subunit
VESPARGAVVAFSGTVRDTEEGRPLRALHYEAYVAMGEREIARILTGLEKKYGVALAAVHRLGRVPAGESSFLVACAGRHRPEAFAACRRAVDTIKSDVPIWKVKWD